MICKTKSTIIFIALLAITMVAQAETYYVRLDGSNNNNGTENSPAGAWKSLSHAFANLEGGDQLYIADGLYETAPLTLKNIHGTEENPTIISSIHPLGAIITLQGSPEWGNTLVADNCSYLIIDGLEVYQEAPTKGTGIQASNKSHHVTIRNCYVHDCGCNGISARGSDYVTVEKNIVHDNAKRSEYNCSGISYFLPTEYDQEPGFHHIIRQNIVFNNECRLPFTPGGFDTPTDGNGIILDLFNNKNNSNEGEPGGYYQATLIENNLSFNNGGRGIHIFQSDNVTVRNNTTWHNLHVLSEYDKWKGDMESFESRDLSIYNNLIVQNPDLPTQGLRMYETKGEGTTVVNNIIVGVTDFWPQTPAQRNNQVKPKSQQDYPQLINPTTDINFSAFTDFRNYFGVATTSPAIDAGYADNFSPVDLHGSPRPYGDKPDIGCYETDAGTGIERNITQKTPGSFELLQNYPNPFNPTTTIAYDITKPTHVHMNVYNIAGQHVAEVVNEEKAPGHHSIVFNGEQLDSGTYLLKIRAGNFSDVKKMTLIK